MSAGIESIIKEYPNNVYNYFQLQNIKEIARGPYGIMYFVRQIADGTHLMARRFTNDNIAGKQLELYIREFRAMISLKHPFLNPALGFTNRAPYSIIMRFINGRSLFNIIHDKSDHYVLSNNDKLKIVLGISSAMMYLHSLNITNFDLRPHNIFVSKDGLPIIFYYGITRLIDVFASANFRHEPSAWMAPELYIVGQSTSKVDVFAFGIILWELLTEHFPFPSVKPSEFRQHVAVNGERPLLPFDTPKTLKKMIELCWHQDPDQRPSFKKIYELFSTGKVTFENTDNKPREQIGAIVAEWESHNKPQRRCSIVVESVPNLFKSKMPKDILEYTETIDETSCNELYTGVAELIRQNVPNEVKGTALFEVLKLISTNPACLEAYINSNQIDTLPFFDKELSEIALCILIPIFSSHPEVLKRDLLKIIDSLIQHFPQKVIRLFYVICGNQLPLNLYGQIVDLLINKAEYFIKGDSSFPLIHLLFKLISTVPQIKEGRSQYIIKIFSNCLSCSANDSLLAAYSALEVLRPPVIAVDPNIFCRHLADHAIRIETLRLLCFTRPEKVNNKLIEAILKETKRTKQAVYAILQLSRYGDVAQIVISTPSLWLLDPEIPTFISLKIFIILLQQSANAQKLIAIPEVASLLSKSVDSDQPEAYDTLCTLIRKLPVTPLFIQALATSEFITNYLNVAVASDNEGIQSRAYFLVDYLCRIKFVPEFLVFLPVAVNHLKNSQKLRMFAMTYCSVINVNPQGRQALLQTEALQIINSFSNPNNK